MTHCALKGIAETFCSSEILCTLKTKEREREREREREIERERGIRKFFTFVTLFKKKKIAFKIFGKIILAEAVVISKRLL